MLHELCSLVTSNLFCPQKVVRTQLGNKFRNKRKRDASEEVTSNKRHRALPNYAPKEQGEDAAPFVEKMRQGLVNGDEVCAQFT